MNSKRVLLIHPEISRTKYNFAGVIDNEPLELEYIAALLKERGYSVEIWDGQVDAMPAAEKIRSFSPEFLYVCGRTRQENFIKEYCREGKREGAVTIVGGLHAQHNFRRLFEDSVDYVLTTFDIFVLADLIDGASPETLCGVCYKLGGVWRENPAKPFDISRLPRPDRSKFYAHSDRYRYLELLPCAHVRTAYSCPYSCVFCSRNKLNCGVYSARDIADVVDEIEQIDCPNIYFIDDDFLIDRKRVEEFLRLVRERGIEKKYVCYGRADFITKNADLLPEMKAAGFYYILAGLEAISDRALSAYNKKTDVETNTEAVRLTNEAGINLMGMFIADLDFTAKDFRELYRWIKKNKLLHTAVSIFTPELSSVLYEQYRERIITDDPAAWDYLHVVARPLKMSLKRYYFCYHMLMVKLFLKGQRDGIYDFVDYGFYIKSFLKNMFRFGG